MIRAARRNTGRPLRAAMTLTVTEQNLSAVAGVVRWLIRNRDAFSLVSFQPLAKVGRTRKSLAAVDADSRCGARSPGRPGWRSGRPRRCTSATRPAPASSPCS